MIRFGRVGRGRSRELRPELLSLVINRPLWLVGAGLALLTGKSLLTLIAKIDKHWR